MTGIIDAHHHLIDPTAIDYPWMTAELGALRRPFGIAELEPELAAAGVSGTVVVQARHALEETRALLAVAGGARVVRGVVGWVDLTDPGIDDVLGALRGEPGGDRLVGIRHQVQDEPDPSWLRRPEVERGVEAVGRAGLAYDLLVRARELPAAIELVRRRSEVRFVLDHLGKPPIASGSWEPWAERFRAIAGEPNVSAKLSGLVTEATWDTWTVDDLRPPVHLAFEVFGADRLMFGSDWPVCRLAASYPSVVAATRELIASLSADEQSAILGRTAERVYRLDLGS
jgi:L-fuconolactonase